MASVTEEIQEIKTDSPQENFSFVPKYAKRFFVSNIFTRSVSHIVGYFGNIALRLQCTAAGVLRVAPETTAHSVNDTFIGNAPDAYGTSIDLSVISSAIDIFIWDNSVYVKRSVDGVTYDDEIEIPANSAYTLDATTRYILIKNKTAGNVGRYQIISWR